VAQASRLPWGVLALYFRGRDARSSRAGGPRPAPLFFRHALSALGRNSRVACRALSNMLSRCRASN